jgi:integrase
LVSGGQKSERWLEDVKATGTLILEALGRSWAVDALTPADFAVLYARLAKTKKPKSGSKTAQQDQPQRQVRHATLNNRIMRVRTMFNWFLKEGILEKPPAYGSKFDAPGKVALENQRLERGAKNFTQKQVRALLRHAKDQPSLYAAILLALNTGCQNVDIETLRRCHLDLSGGWYVQPRAKRGKLRRAKLWPRTIKAMRAVIGDRELGDDDLVFLSKSGGEWDGRNCVSKEFAALKKRAGIKKERCGFQWLRHTFITQASQGGDLVAVQLAVGHADRTITAIYIHGVYDPRLVSIANLVDRWLTMKEGGQQ